MAAAVKKNKRKEDARGGANSNQNSWESTLTIATSKKNLFRFIHQNNGLTTPNIYAEECICLDSFYFYSALDLPAEI